MMHLHLMHLCTHDTFVSAMIYCQAAERHSYVMTLVRDSWTVASSLQTSARVQQPRQQELFALMT